MFRKINARFLAIFLAFQTLLCACHVDDVLDAGWIGTYDRPIRGTPQERGALAEEAITDYFASKGFIPCDVKVGSNNGVDHFFVAEVDGEKLYVVNESKYQREGGLPVFGRYRLSDGTKCYQQSWYWIADRMNRFSAGPRGVDEKSTCVASRGFSILTGGARDLCTSCSSDVRKVLKNLKAKVVRTATVMDEHGRVHLFAVMDHDEGTIFHNRALKALGIKAMIAECPKRKGHYVRRAGG